MGHGIVGARTRGRPVGLVVQVVMSLVLLFISGSSMAALLRLHATDPGFDVAGRLYAYTFLPSPPFPPDARYDVYAKALDRLRALPGVRTAALTSSLPLIPPGSECASLSLDSPIRVTSSAVDTTYFDTLGIERVAGRLFAASDLTDAAASVVVTESLARRLWPIDLLSASASWSDVTARSPPLSSALFATPQFGQLASRHNRMSIASSRRVTRAHSRPCSSTRRSIRPG